MALAKSERGAAPSLRSGLYFTENKGQIVDQHGQPRTDIDFVLETPEMTLFIGAGMLEYQFMRMEGRLNPASVKHQQPVTSVRIADEQPVVISRLDVELQDAQRDARIVKQDPSPVTRNYYNVSNRQGLEGIESFGKIVYENIYPHIDWVLYTEGAALKYDFVVRPGAQVSAIRLAYSGGNLKLLESGELEIRTPLGTILESAPYSYEAENRREVASSFRLKGNTLTYDVAAYTGSLVIDPGVKWSSYYGGAESDHVSAVAMDKEGYLYVAGWTPSSNNIATTGAFLDTISSTGTGPNGLLLCGFLAKFDSLGTLQWASYYGGEGLDQVTGVASDDFGRVYITGMTSSRSGIATPGAFKDAFPAILRPNPNFSVDTLYVQTGFLAQFNSDGTRNWGSYYGEIASDYYIGLSAIACDAEGNVYIGGSIDSSTVPTVNGFQTRFGGGDLDGLLVKFDSSGNREWATWYGGEGNDAIRSIEVDDSGAVFVGGLLSPLLIRDFTQVPPIVFKYSDTGIATPGTFIDSFDNDGNKAFLSKFDSDGQRVWGSYLRSGSQNFDLALDTFGHVYVAGSIQTLNDTMVTTAGTFQPVAINRQNNAFLLQLDAATGLRNWGTFYGAENTTTGMSVACGPEGTVYLAGSTRSLGTLSATIATEGSYQDSMNTADTAVNNPQDLFVAQFDSTGQRLWASYFGGPRQEDNAVLTQVSESGFYLAGTTSSSQDIASAGVHQTTFGGSSTPGSSVTFAQGDVFLVRFVPIDLAVVQVAAPEQDTLCTGPIALEIEVVNKGGMDKTDTLYISYSFYGPVSGQVDTFYTDVIPAGDLAMVSLGEIEINVPGTYNATVWLHHTLDDQRKYNDTLHYTFTTTNAEPVSEISVNQVGTTYHFSNPSGQASDTYHWDFGDGTTSDEENPSHSYAETDSYLVTLITTGFCGSDTATMLIEGIGDGSGIVDPALAAKLSVYPNPADAVLFIKTEPGLRAEAYRIVNVLGQELMSGKLEQSAHLDIRNLSAGSYFLDIRTDKGMVSKAFQVLKK